jgi:hypothetical protein
MAEVNRLTNNIRTPHVHLASPTLSHQTSRLGTVGEALSLAESPGEPSHTRRPSAALGSVTLSQMCPCTCELLIGS